MSIKLTKRVAAALLKRGVSSVRITPTAVEEARKALTREDVRAMIKSGGVYAIKEKHNLSLYSIALNKKRSQGRKRGQGKRRGSIKARGGVDYKKSIRAQRRVLRSLKDDRTMDNVMFKKLYLLVKGGSFPNKVTLLNRIRSEGIALDDQKFEKLRHA
jgi:large subunit ribosomal protein L19e